MWADLSRQFAHFHIKTDQSAPATSLELDNGPGSLLGSDVLSLDGLGSLGGAGALSVLCTSQDGP